MEKINIIERKRIELIVISAIYIVIGILFCVLPNQMLEILETVICVGCMVYGVFFMFVYLVTPDIFKDYATILKAIIAIAFGLLLIFVKSFFVMAVGAVIIFTGVKNILSAKAYKTLGDKKWWTDLVAGIIYIVAGVTLIVLCNTDVATKVVMIYMGLSLIVTGLVNYAFMFLIHKRVKKVKEEVKEAIEEAEKTNNFTDYEVK